MIEMAHVRREEFVDGLALEFIVLRANKSFWFIEEDGDGFAWDDARVADFDEVFFSNRGRKVGTDFTIYHDAAFLDEFIALTARINTTGGEVFIEANAEFLVLV